MPVIGYLRSTTAADAIHLATAFRQGLKEAGFVEGQNVAIEYRYADNQMERLPALVADLLHRKVAVIAGNAIAMPPAKAATATVPIVFAAGGDPVRDGLVASLNRPGGKLTGFTIFEHSFAGKWLEMPKEVVPAMTRVAVMQNPDHPAWNAYLNAIRGVASRMGVGRGTLLDQVVKSRS